jgi:hypothetical protein
MPNQMEEALRRAGYEERQQPVATRQLDEARAAGRVREALARAVWDYALWTRCGSRQPNDNDRRMARGVVEFIIARMPEMLRDVGLTGEVRIGQDPGS